VGKFGDRHQVARLKPSIGVLTAQYVSVTEFGIGEQSFGDPGRKEKADPDHVLVAGCWRLFESLISERVKKLAAAQTPTMTSRTHQDVVCSGLQSKT
jgi:hypothetical protein